ncbi:hypothetical protein LTSEBAI_1883, partial [Salmonella enterica subsp. enterica serovar Baildon str. R6-199]
MTMSPAPARWVAMISPLGLMMEASVEPAPRSRIASEWRLQPQRR